MTARRIKIQIAYDGTAYHGWQRQPDLPTVQATIESAIAQLCNTPIEITGSSRTDAGVHALGQVAHFDIDTPVPTANFTKALNNILPDDIAILGAADVGTDFDAISDTKTKLYRYMICTAPVRPVMDIRYCWHRPGDLNAGPMKKAAALLIGKKDFKSFASAADNRTSSTRTITHCSIMKEESWIYIDVAADGFLYNMVRNITGTLVEVGRGKWPPEKITEILEAKNRTAAGPIAPPSGLTLIKIDY
jgi:tRNA pseudouridine38-40 synthase